MMANNIWEEIKNELQLTYSDETSSIYAIVLDRISYVGIVDNVVILYTTDPGVKDIFDLQLKNMTIDLLSNKMGTKVSADLILNIENIEQVNDITQRMSKTEVDKASQNQQVINSINNKLSTNPHNSNVQNNLDNQQDSFSEIPKVKQQINSSQTFDNFENQNQNNINNDNSYSQVINNSQQNSINNDSFYDFESDYLDYTQEEDSRFKELKHKVEIKAQSNVSQENIKQFQVLFSKCTFDSFVEGDSNAFAYNAARTVAEYCISGQYIGSNLKLSENYNPFFIYSKSGLGKTHLLIAIANEIISQNKTVNVRYSTAKDFLDLFVKSSQHKKMAKFEQKYLRNDVLLLDDFQVLEGKNETLLALFNLINDMTSSGKQVVISSDRPVKDYTSLDERLTSRFLSGLCVDIQLPSFETRRAIIGNFYNHQMTLSNFTGIIPDEVLDYIAENITSNIRQMEGALNRLIGHMNIFKKPAITLEDAKKVLADLMIDNSINKIDVELIQHVIEQEYNITHEELIGSSKRSNLVLARHVAMYFCRVLTNDSLMQIASAFGGRDHSTVTYANSKIESELQKNQSFYREIKTLQEKIKKAC